MRDGLKTLVVDASVAVKWYLADEPDVERARAVFERFLAGELRLIAPGQIRYEVASAITVATRARTPRLAREEGATAIREFLALRIEMFDEDGMIVDAYRLVHQHGVAFYDALYLALAERLAVPFITADRRLYERVRQLLYVMWIADYAPDRG